MKIPKVTVLMSVYNTKEEYLRESIESILTQTLTDFEFLIYDDASTDGSNFIVSEYAAKDNRIVHLRNVQNIGLTRTLNNGLERAKGKYVARMDADDISLPTRLNKQIEFMECNQEIIALGTACYIKNENKIMKRKIKSTNPQYIKASLFFGNTSLVHSSMMLRRDFFTTHKIYYNNDIKRSQDYDLWVRATRLGDITAIKEPLVEYRISNDQISSYAKEDQQNFKHDICISQLSDIGISPDIKQCDNHIKLCDRNPDFEVGIMNDWISKLITQNKETEIFKESLFKTILYKTYFIVLAKGILKYHCSNSSLFNKSKALLECVYLAPRILSNAISSKL
ncbi:glycosyltransferase family 2 protein [Clostridium vincentii]|uniref:Putative glycosyltransferase EpsE n=1 Tax=Clostridium vincentii TaxID=52704 RepID=A0A2T0BD51_9CLOT|nr:glycosyltransferase [Clostridium vincentii]PRR81762.1 putative glycosyltransferase EpsE [Clostridium vincentii]